VEKVSFRRFVICWQIHIIFCIDEIITLISHYMFHIYWIHESGQTVIPIIELLEPKEYIFKVTVLIKVIFKLSLSCYVIYF